MDESKEARTVEHDGQIVQLRDRTNDVLFMDLRTYGHYSQDGYKELNDSDVDVLGNPQVNEVKLIKETLFNWQSPDWKTKYKDVPEFCKSVSESVIGDKDHVRLLRPEDRLRGLQTDHRPATRLERQEKD